MKRIYIWFTLIIALAAGCQKFDYEAILEQLRDHESRIQKLETLCNQLNSNIEAVQTIIQAQNSRDYVTDIVKIMENGVEVGYSITFAQSGTVTIYHGSDGADGAAPKIGIRKASDGEYYWTSDDEWMTDDQGEKIPASVPNDPDGKYITPSFRIAEGIWYISYDGGNTWQELEDISKDEEEGDGEGGQFFTDVTYDDEYIYLTLRDGTLISIPRGLEAADKAVEYPFSYDGYLGPGGVLMPTSSPGAGSSNVTRTTEYIDITDAKSIYYHGRMGPVNNYYSLGFYDADKNFIEELSISGTGNIETYYITLDEKYAEAAYVRGSWAKGTLNIEETYDFIFIIDGKPEELEEPEVDVNEGNILFTEVGYLGQDGAMVPEPAGNLTRTTDYINITQAQRLYYHGRMGNVNHYYSIAFYDYNKKFIPELSICGTGNVETYNIELTDKYKKATYVRASWAKGSSLSVDATYAFVFIVDGPIPQKPEKRFAVLCDSIGTHGNSGEYCNVVEVEIMPEDVGVELNAYLTYYDVHNTNNGSSSTGPAIEFVLGGQTFTEADNGKLITFTPTAEDIGKKVGRVYNYNPNSLKTWWMWLAEAYNMEPIPVCWSSSSISSHETTTPRLVNSYAWHDSQVRKCGVRIPGSNDRIAPDYIIIARGCNDWSHGKGTLITDGYFDNPETWTYPMTDEVGTYYGIKEAISLTVKNMREAYPKAKIYLCTITMNNRGSKNTFPPCYGGKSMVSFNRAIRECAEFFGCGLLDLASCGVTYENLKTYAPDGTHLNAAGHKLAGKKAIADFEPTKINKNEYQSGPLEYGSITSSPSGLRGGIVDYIAVKPDFHSSIIGKTIKKIKVYRVEDQGNPSAATIKIGKIKLESGFDSTSVTAEELNSAYKNISSVHTYNVSSFPYNKVMQLECDITLYKNEYLCFVTKDGHCVGFCDNAVSEPQMMYYYNNVVNAYKTQHLPISVTVEN